MIKVIKHGNTVHTYKCGRCGCIFIADNSEIKDSDVLLECPECRFYIFEHDIIDDQEINQETINIPSCRKARKQYKKTDKYDNRYW